MRRLIGLIVLALALLPARAQQLEDSVFTLGTVTQDKTLRHWSYVLVQPTRPDLLAARKLALYRKAGESDSAANYERRTILTLQTDPGIIGAMLQRAANVGDDLGALSNRVENLFAGLVPAGSLSLADKLSAVIRGSLNQPHHYNNLIQLGRLHPAVNLCLGLAAADELSAPGTYTYEVRDYDLLANADRGVLGRVTVETGKPTVLPAPGGPFEVKDPSGKGHLNVKLRWATAPEFRRLSLLSYGFNLYRVERAFAEDAANKFHLNPPKPGVLAMLSTVSPKVALVNNVPVLTSQNLDDSAPANPNSVLNPTNKVAFIADDHGLASGGQPFKDGEAYYYFVAGRDILGRDGTNSPGTLVLICDRIPPDAPHLPKVENYYQYVGGMAKHRLQVNWKPVVPTDGETKIVGYHVYRWKAPADIAKFENNPGVNRVNAALIPHIPGQTSYTFLDDGAGAPTVPADNNKTFWYSVRAVDGASCDGGNLSANSPPAFGVLREYDGPNGPEGGGIRILCCEPLLSRGKGQETDRDPKLDPKDVIIDLICTRKDDGIAWAEFWFAFGPGTSNYVGRISFQPGQSNVVRRLVYPRDFLDDFDNLSTIASCRVGTEAGKMSDIGTIGIGGLPTPTVVRPIQFLAQTRCDRKLYYERKVGSTVPGAGRDDCVGHSPNPPKPVDDPNEPGWEVPVVVIPLTPTTKEFRLYRRVDFGPLTLIKQGQANYDAVTNLVVEILDNDLPANSGIVCYYGQLFDEHGNPSPLTQLGDCLPILKISPTPLLAPLEPVGDDANPKMRIRWFCPPFGVERFELWVGVVNQPPVNTLIPELSNNQAPNPNLDPINPSDPPAEQILPNFGVYLTPQPGLNFGSGAAFDVTVPIKTGRRYYVSVKVVRKGGADGKKSNIESLFWKAPPVAQGPQVPWPARPLPEVVAVGGFNPAIKAARVKAYTFDGIGVNIGFVLGVVNDKKLVSTITDDKRNTIAVFNGSVDPQAYIYQNAAMEKLLPVALYRYQVPSAGLPVVSGDVVQVSPLMRSIATAVEVGPNNNTYTRIYDPFILLTPQIAGASVSPSPIYLLDTQPVIVGAKYAYLLVRFDQRGEIIEVIPTDPVEATLTPP
jgi:hypothetical protein